MARVVAYVPDLLFGSNVLAQLNGRGHETVLAVEDNPGLRRILVKQLEDLYMELYNASRSARPTPGGASPGPRPRHPAPREASVPIRRY